jgi:hypothetical protein
VGDSFTFHYQVAGVPIPARVGNEGVTDGVGQRAQQVPCLLGGHLPELQSGREFYLSLVEIQASVNRP